MAKVRVTIIRNGRDKPAATGWLVLYAASAALFMLGSAATLDLGSSSQRTFQVRPTEAVNNYAPVAVAKADPQYIRIPAIEAGAPVVPLEAGPDGSLAVPEKTEQVGWYRGGFKPGQSGPAVMVGHLDGQFGPAVFWNLGKLEVGDRIEVGLSDGTALTFRVQRMESFDRDRFPTQEVYAGTKNPALRLITCSGPFDRSEGKYIRNLVVFAELEPGSG